MRPNLKNELNFSLKFIKNLEILIKIPEFHLFFCFLFFVNVLTKEVHLFRHFSRVFSPMCLMFQRKKLLFIQTEGGTLAFLNFST